MAQELSINISAALSKGNLKASVSPGVLKVDVTGSVFIDNVQTVGTSEEAVVFGDVATPGYVYVRNLDATNYVQLGATTGVYTIKLMPGENALFRLSGTTLFALANTAACNVQVVAIAN
jgi:hypothetical protein